MTEMLKKLMSYAIPHIQLTREQWFEAARQRMIALSLDETIVGRIGEDILDMLESARRRGWGPVETVDVLAVCYISQSNEMLQHYCVNCWGMSPEILETSEVH